MNHLDFELAVGNIDILEYNQRINQRVEHFNSPLNDNCNTGADEDASADTDEAPEAVRDIHMSN